jgi:hypothetical protein
MGKYTNLQSDIFTVFNSNDWKAELINTFPENFVPSTTGDDYIRVSVIPAGNGVNRLSLTGILIADIFVAGGAGPKRASAIADKLDAYLEGKTLATIGNNTTAFLFSSLKPVGQDEDNPSLYRFSYSIPFNFFGAM